MSIAYLDSSCFVARMLKEPGGSAMLKRAAEFDGHCSSTLLEAEVRSAAARENVIIDEHALARLTWIVPQRRLDEELLRVFDAGYLRGADAWHLACALFFFPEPEQNTFLTLDANQRSVARALGFRT